MVLGICKMVFEGLSYVVLPFDDAWRRMILKLNLTSS